MDKELVAKISAIINEIKAKFEELHKLSKENNENIEIRHSVEYSDLYVSCDVNNDYQPDFFWNSSGW